MVGKKGVLNSVFPVASLDLVKTKAMQKLINSKNLFYFSFAIAGYFLLLYINGYIIKSEHILIGFFQNLLTIPMLIIQLLALFVSIKFCIKEKFQIKKYSFWAFFILLISSLFTLGSIFIARIN
jgi:hypothetical protein